ncbi:putative ABC transporter substrate-binding protein [Microlunatus phosphovorus NM-1]|uniref:Putative ABC transporter substrate-binding protein n=1 Tax=Microlunatus phosphovorus (strain ATCC 700054 / DSM 10555 / JCM 9379 / NBRC 101784 / NCIMB 13414 / VKM Ac-1990 / NM-1) TaxID=1032480 RepID=F5XKM7_MICPN|nr:ABC transporter substrate-binding protein [Microlunatus phosphovorus]BAK36099.1 putative ABC transporter substrate-binding protein [Microlunatus phosphovorus NM-1]
MRTITKLALVSASIAATLLSACGSDSLSGGGTPGSPTAEVSANTDLNAKLPENIRSSGKLNIGTDASYAPNQFTEGKKIVGSEVDLFNAVAKKLGVTAEWENAKFGTIIPGITSGKYDLGVSSFTINDERRKQVLMVSYFNAGTQWATQAGNPKGIDPNNPCGKNIAVQADTVQDQNDLPARQKKCGSNPMKIQKYAGQDTVTAAVVTGKADAMLADSPVTAYAVSQSGGKLELLGEVYDAAPYGVVVAKDNKQLADVVAEALTEMKSDGSYLEILKAWGTEGGAIDTFEVK